MCIAWDWPDGPLRKQPLIAFSYRRKWPPQAKNSRYPFLRVKTHLDIWFHGGSTCPDALAEVQPKILPDPPS
jgi:hypothetical protein